MVRYALPLALLAVSCSRPPVTPRPQTETVPDSEKVNATAEQIEVTDTIPPAEVNEPASQSAPPQDEELKRHIELVKRLAEERRKMPAPQRFNIAPLLSDESNLLRAQWYTAPYRRHYRVLKLSSDGTASTWREVRTMESQARSHGWLSKDQLVDIQAKINALDLEPTSPATPRSGQIHMVLTFRTDDGVIRHDFLGSVPPKAQAIIDFVGGEIEAQWRTRHQERWNRIRERVRRAGSQPRQSPQRPPQ